MTEALSVLEIAREPVETGVFEAPDVVRHLTHELRQPLSAIESIAYYLGMILPREDARPHQQIDKLQQLVQQMSWILSDAVHYLQAVPPSPQAVDLNELVTESMGEHSREGAAAPIQAWLSDDVAAVTIDPAQGKHLVRTLIAVFSQLARSRAAVSVRTEVAGSRVQLTVSAPAQLSRETAAALFEPFAPNLPPGSGLGLASAKRIVEMHGGTLGIQSGAIGTSLEIALPRAL